MESQNKVQVRVGVFLAITLAAAIVSILVLGGDKTLFQKYVRLYARLDQVQGLNVGSIVSLTGIKIGNVEKIDFAHDGSALILTMKVEAEPAEHIPKGSTVEIRTQGALGDKYLYINPGDATLGFVKSGETLEAAKSSDLMGILSEKGGEAAKIFDVISEVHKLMKTINTDNRSEKIMRNLSEASESFKKMADESRQLVSELRGQNQGSVSTSIRKLENILTKIDKGEGTLGALINDPSLHDQLKSLLGNNQRRQYFQSVIQNSLEKKGP